MQSAARTRTPPATYAPADGSRTLTITNDPTREEGDDDENINSDSGRIVGSLRVRAGRSSDAPRVAWDEDVVDNEGCGKKKSKICCIYHKPKQFDESSDESSDSDSDSSCGGHDHTHNHNHNRPPPTGPSSSGQQSRPNPSGTVHQLEHPEGHKPNAYEKQPHSKKGKHRAA
ncbi:hypothetical protein NLJ89_g3971 [Agrocybe chaxingu]|uniref:Type 1 phosphatases regulator n=1 Tax=Agrocybe chaxingu TaxID=84603 RepID=A0A9W8K478_9AGAR|nr:hypothetical protein NLJ89_g3971 [Agrocybe chaxingu]